MAMEQMFLGKFYHTIDAKFRLTIPALYRELVPEGIYLSEDIQDNLVGRSKEGYAEFCQRTSSMDPFEKRTHELKRMIGSGTQWLEYDNTGRILIPSFMISYAHLESEVVIAGSMDYFEIWNADRWAELYQKSIDDRRSGQW